MAFRYFVFGAVASCVSATGLSLSNEFKSAMDAAMTRMHVAMMTESAGDPDRDFARMMIPHHQGAIDMAELELRFGKDERLRRLAQGIIVEQRQEIEVMRRILSEERALPDREPRQSAGTHHPGEIR